MKCQMGRAAHDAAEVTVAHGDSAGGLLRDPNGGWKGRGLWSTYAGCATWHIEGDRERPKVVKFQLRPDPLAR